MSETFGAMVRRLRVAAGASQNGLARSAGIDPAYLNRMERPSGPNADRITLRGEGADQRVRPSRLVVCALAQALGLGSAECDRFLYAAGLAPSLDWQTRAEAAEAILARVRFAVSEDEPIPLRQERRA